MYPIADLRTWTLTHDSAIVAKDLRLYTKRNLKAPLWKLRKLTRPKVRLRYGPEQSWGQLRFRGKIQTT